MDRERAAARWELVLPHRAALVRLARSRGMSGGDAEECAQEAMLRCVEFERLDETRVLPFLVTTTIRLCADRGRQHARDHRLAARLTTWAATEPSPEEAACDRAEAAWLADALGPLTETQRGMLDARAAGLDHTEVARRLSVSYKTVESQMYRVRARARTLLSGSYGAVVAWFRRPSSPQRAAALASVTAVATLALTGLTPPEVDRRPDVPLDQGMPARHGAIPVAATVVPIPTPNPEPLPAASPVPASTPSPRPIPTMSCEFQHEGPDYCFGPPFPTESPTAWDPVGAVLACVRYGYNNSHGFECNESPTPGEPQ